MVGARMANLKKGGAGGSTVSDSSMETSQPAVSIERAAELSGSTPASIKPIVQSGHRPCSMEQGSPVVTLGRAAESEEILETLRAETERVKKEKLTGNQNAAEKQPDNELSDCFHDEHADKTATKAAEVFNTNRESPSTISTSTSLAISSLVWIGGFSDFCKTDPPLSCCFTLSTVSRDTPASLAISSRVSPTGL
jgi:hypothetical protein